MAKLMKSIRDHMEDENEDGGLSRYPARPRRGRRGEHKSGGDAAKMQQPAPPTSDEMLEAALADLRDVLTAPAQAEGETPAQAKDAAPVRAVSGIAKAIAMAKAKAAAKAQAEADAKAEAREGRWFDQTAGTQLLAALQAMQAAEQPVEEPQTAQPAAEAVVPFVRKWPTRNPDFKVATRAPLKI